jgi:hypothetical protein
VQALGTFRRKSLLEQALRTHLRESLLVQPLGPCLQKSLLAQARQPLGVYQPPQDCQRRVARALPMERPERWARVIWSLQKRPQCQPLPR